VYSSSYRPLFSPFMNTRPLFVPMTLIILVGSWQESSVWKKLSLLSWREIPSMVAVVLVQMMSTWVISSIKTSRSQHRPPQRLKTGTRESINVPRFALTRPTDSIISFCSSYRLKSRLSSVTASLQLLMGHTYHYNSIKRADCPPQTKHVQFPQTIPFSPSIPYLIISLAYISR